MGFILTVGALVLVVWFAFRVATALRVRRATTAELEHAVLEVPMDYLEFIGLQRSSVVRFRELVERKDLALLYKEWPKLEKDFLAGEREAGHSGRPLIMDYLLDHRAYIRELKRRKS
jgi:hypothetical protein